MDVYDVEAKLCDDVGICYQLLDDLVRHLGMHKQAPPLVFRSPHEEFPDKQGISGWVPLIESGVSIHTLTLKRFVTLDVYTCGMLQPRETIDFACRYLGSRRFESHFLERGREYSS